jgi:hypothetical protein
MTMSESKTKLASSLEQTAASNPNQFSVARQTRVELELLNDMQC